MTVRPSRALARGKCCAWSAAKSGKQWGKDRLGLPYAPNSQWSMPLLTAEGPVTVVTQRCGTSHAPRRAAPIARYRRVSRARTEFTVVEIPRNGP